jgi:SAM-dependent methyltransferase
MQSAVTPRDVTAINRDFYDALWQRARVHRADDFNTWPLIAALLPTAPDRLEIGPGLHPRVPIAGSHFVDLSAQAVERLSALGGSATQGVITALMFAPQRFDLVVAFDVIEHVEDDDRACSELYRVLKPGGRLLMSVPLHADRWTEFDVLVGHARRYDLPVLHALLGRHGLAVEKSAAFGMRPTNPRLLRHGMRWLAEHRETAMRWYNWILMPLGLKFQKRLNFFPGWIDAADADGMVLVCQRDRP